MTLQSMSATVLLDFPETTVKVGTVKTYKIVYHKTLTMVKGATLVTY